jgi:amino acid adenylation domain-containing protein
MANKSVPAPAASRSGPDGVQTSGIEIGADRNSLPTAFQQVVASHGSRMAVCSDTWQASYDELNARANRLAHALMRRGGAPGDRVAILMQHDTPQIAAVLAVLKAGRIVVTLNPVDPATRLRQVVEDAAPGLVLTDHAHREAAAAIAGANTSVVCCEDEIADGPAHNPGIVIAPNATAHLVFTSGSTGRPKGVQQTHGQILHQTVGYTRATELTCDDRLTLLAALSGGQGVCTTWTALLNGAALLPFSVIENSTAGLAEWITDREITVYFSSASLFRHFMKSLDENVCFPGVRAVRLSSEMATQDDFRIFQRHFSDGCTFVHTLASSEIGLIAYLRLSRRDFVAEGRIPVGRPVEGIEVRLLDEQGQPVAPGQAGEIVARSRHMSSGYWRNAALTSERYAEASDGSGDRIIHTGDLGRFNSDGMLEFIGRKDSRIKIRGYSIEPAEVEAAIREAPGIDQVVVGASNGPNGQPQLVAHVIQGDRHPHNAQSLRQALRATLPGYMLPSAFVFVDEFPLTAHGKIDRARLAPVPLPLGTTRSNGQPLTETGQRLTGIWEQVFDLAGIGADADFFDLGGDSLIAAVMSAYVHEAFGVDVHLETFFDHPTLSELARAIDEMRQSGTPDAAVPRPERARAGPLPLTYNQESFWHLPRSPEAAASQTISRCSRILGPLDVEVLSDCIGTIVRRHEMLRTSFSEAAGRPVQIVHPPADVPLPLHDFADEPDAESKARQVWKAEGARAFDLTKPPLVSFALIRLRSNEHWLVYTAHAILLDGLSWSIFFSELARLYEARIHGQDTPLLNAPPPQYGDYAVWQRQALHPDGGAYRDMLAWWTNDVLAASYPDHPMYRKALLWCMNAVRPKRQLLKKAAGLLLRSVLRPPLPPRSELPFKRAKPASGVDPSEGMIGWGLKSDVSRRLNELGRHEGATEYMTRLAAFVAVLAAETGDPNVVLYTALSNRNQPATRGLFGCCASLVVLMFRCDGTSSFREFLAAVRDRVRTMQRHADLPYDRVHREMRAWKIKMPQGHAILSVARTHPGSRCGGVEISQLPDRVVSAMPAIFNVMLDAANEEENCYVLFDAGVYDPARVRKFIDRFITLLDLVSRRPDITIDQALALTDGR